ncbi:MAG TPA: cadmium resistance transporter [Acidimicrobiales bacterium]|nr:cadmium resistance transporter [Acidimicrobiales bacterium]
MRDLARSRGADSVAAVRGLLDVVGVGSLAFVGTMFDDYFAFGAQLIVTDRARYRRVATGQALGVAAVVAISAAVGSLLAVVPLRAIGLLAIAPIALAVHAWRHRRDERRTVFRRGALTTFVVTLGLSGDNVAVWTPLLRARGVVGGLGVVATFAAWEALFVLSAMALAAHPRVVEWGTRRAPLLVPWVYVGLGALILVECHTLG